jgi:hypothetical protein
MSQDLWQRWDDFLAKIAERQREILVEAEPAVRDIIYRFPDDPLPLGNAIEGLRHRTEQLKTKVNDAWGQQVESKFEEIAQEFANRGRDRKDDFLLDLAERWELFSAQMMCTFYRNVRNRAEAGARRAVMCGHCGATLDLPTREHAVSHACTACGSVNQVMADRAVSQRRGIGRATAELECIPLRYAIHRFRKQVHRQRRATSWAPEPIESMDRWLEMERAYWEKLVSVAASALGESPDTALVKSRVDHFIELELKTDQRWRRAKGL